MQGAVLGHPLTARFAVSGVADTLQHMDAATTLRRAREGAGLSVSALARKAGVPTSTASRVEHGTLDPTVTMMSRLLAATGTRLAVDDTLLDDSLMLTRLATSAVGDEVDLNWVEIRHLVDQLEHEPDRIPDAISTPPPRSGNERLDTLLAAIAERLADEHGLDRPRWCSQVPPLADPWEAHGTPRIKARSAAEAPHQFRERNILLSARHLWRDHALER